MPDRRCSPLRRRIKVHPLPRAGEHRGRVAVTVGLLPVKMRVNLGLAAVCYQLDQIGVEHHGFAQRDEFRPARFPGLGDVVGGVEFAHADKG